MDIKRPMLAGALCLALCGAAVAQEREVARDVMGCANWDDFTSLLQYARDNDNEAFKRAWLRADCTNFKVGERVFVVEQGFVSVKLRRRGDLTGYWTVIEAILKH